MSDESKKHRPMIEIDGKELPDVRVGDVWIHKDDEVEITMPWRPYKRGVECCTWRFDNGFLRHGAMFTHLFTHIVTRDGKPYEPPAPPKPVLPVAGERCVIDGLEFRPILLSDNGIIGSRLLHMSHQSHAAAPSIVGFAGYYYPGANGEPGVIVPNPARRQFAVRTPSGIRQITLDYPTHVVFKVEA
jgi:hypothetical protein